MTRIPKVKAVYYIISQLSGYMMGSPFFTRKLADKECKAMNHRSLNHAFVGGRAVDPFRVEAYRWSARKIDRKKKR